MRARAGIGLLRPDYRSQHGGRAPPSLPVPDDAAEPFADLAAWSVRYDLHVHWCGGRDGGEYMTFSLLQKYLREQEQRLASLVKAHGSDKEAAA